MQMANDSLSRGLDNIQSQHRTTPIQPDYKAGDVKLNFFSNLKNVLGDTLWETYQKTNTITGGALEKAIEDSYYNFDANIGDYGISIEKNAYIDDMKQDYKVTLSKRF